MFYIIISKIIQFFLVLTLFASLMLVKKKTGSKYSPVSVFLTIWIVFLFGALITQYDQPVNTIAILYIVIANHVFASSTLVFNFSRQSGSRIDNFFTTKLVKRLRASFYLISFISVIFVFANIKRQGFNLDDFLFNLVGLSNEYISRRYQGDIEVNFYSIFGLLLAYMSAVLGGMLLQLSMFKGGNKTSIVFISLLPALLTMLTQGAKGSFFLAIFYFLGGQIFAKIITKDEKSLVGSFGYIQLFFISVFISAFLFMTFLSRGNESNNFFLFWNYLSSYAFASLFAFSDWFSFYISHDSITKFVDQDLSFGFETFTSLFKSLGSKRQVLPGYYDEYYSFNNLGTNIYTMFRGLINDFSIFGSIIAVFLSGILVNLMYYLSRFTNSFSPIAISVLVMCPAVFYNSIQISLFIWNGTFVLFFLLTLYFFLIKINYTEK
jgi:oligosaccharide repeat unit polymerase